MPDETLWAKVLDHGYVRLVESWGSDRRIVEAARMSTSKGFLGWGPKVFYDCESCGYRLSVLQRDLSKVEDFCPRCDGPRSFERVEVQGDERLLAYLHNNHHDTPFEMAGATFEVMAPIFVFREWHRHRVQSYNEQSARYAPLPDVNYVPTRARCNPTLTMNKQAQGHRTRPGDLTEDEVDNWISRLEDSYRRAQDCYEEGLSLGIPKEVARVILPVGRYSRMYASAKLRNWLQFLELRQAPNAQWEIRQYADIVCSQLREAFPRTIALFEAGRK